MRRTSVLVLALLLLFGGAWEARADYVFGFSGGSSNFLDVTTTGGPVTLDTATNAINAGIRNQGWWSTTSGNSDSNDNFIAGNVGTTFWNDFFTFDITGLAGSTVTGLTLRIPDSGYSNDNSDTGNDPLTFHVFDVSTDALTLNAKVNNPDVGIYNDLGSGVGYGSFGLALIVPAGGYSMVLNAAAIADLNAAIGRRDTYFSVGGTLQPSDFAVPEPASILMLTVGFVSCGGYSIVRRKKVVNAA